MKTTLVTIAIGALLLLGGCSDKEREQQLESQLQQNQNDRAALQQTLAERDQYLEEIMRTVNDIYSDLETVRAKEKKLVPQAGGSQETPKVSNQDSHQKLLTSINEIGSTLQQNRKKLNDLQARLKNYRGEVANLNKLVENLKTSLAEREQAIAQLQASVQGLEATVNEKTRMIADRDQQLQSQTRTMNTVFYVAGTRDELKNKGIISNEGGFLWGLLGSTTVMTDGFDQSDFKPLDKTAEKTIHLNGNIDEILPHRNPASFATSAIGDTASELSILQPDKFWKGQYLVVVLD